MPLFRRRGEPRGPAERPGPAADPTDPPPERSTLLPGRWWARLPPWFDDEPHVVRLRQRPVRGHNYIHARLLPVAGISMPDVRAAADAFVRAPEQWIELEPDPDNPHDSNAIKVIGVWRDDDGAHRERIGWVPRDDARVLGRAAWPLSATVELLFLPTETTGAGVRFRVWGRPPERRGRPRR